MNIPHDYVPGEIQTQLFGDPLEVCEVCVHPREHFYHVRTRSRLLAADSDGGSWVSADELAAERALADDLADVLDRIADPHFDWHAERERALARYREARK